MTSSSLDTLIEILKVAAEEGHKAHNRWFRRTDLDDAQQEAALAVLEALRTFEESRGTPRRVYVRMAARYAVSDALWAAFSPVSGGKHAPAKVYATISTLRFGSSKEAKGHPLADLPDAHPPADELVDKARWRRAVRARLVELAGGREDLAEALLTESSTAEERRQATALLVRAAQDPTLAKLAKGTS